LRAFNSQISGIPTSVPGITPEFLAILTETRRRNTACRTPNNFINRFVVGDPMRRNVPLLLGILFLISLQQAASGAEEKRRPKGRSLPELMKIIEESDVGYSLRSIKKLKGVWSEKYIDVYFPRKQGKVPYPWIDRREKSGVLVDFPMTPDVAKLIGQAVQSFRKGEKKKSQELFAQALELDQNCYVAHSYLGMFATLSGKFEQAISHHEKAIKINPYDYFPRWQKGLTFVAMKKWKEAKETFIEALVLSPRKKGVIFILKKYSAAMGIEVKEKLFQPKSLVRKKGDIIEVYIDPSDSSDSAWNAYAIAKAVWIGEERPKIERKSPGKSFFSIVGEDQCLCALSSYYLGMSEEGKIKRSKELDDLMDIIWDVNAREQLMYYEMVSRENPYVMLILPDIYRDRMRKFIKKYVVVNRIY
jgi:tetratricopeptide (TPR) repeat protein